MPDRKYHNHTIKRYDNLRIVDFATFLVVCECGTFRAAADKMYITPQGLGYHIQNLERIIGVKLFNRSGKRLRLTPDGEHLREYAQIIIRTIESMHDTVTRLHGRHTGYVQFAHSHSISGTEITGYIEEFKSKYPGIHINMTPVSDTEAHRMVREGGYPALTVAPLRPGKEEAFPLQKYPYILFAHKRHPLAKKAAVSIRDLEGHPLILLDEGHMAHQNIVYLCHEEGFEPQKSYIASGAGSAAALVQDSIGCAVLMQHATKAVELDKIVKVPFEEPVTWDVVFMAPEDYEFTQAEELFYTFLRDRYGPDEAASSA